MEKLKNYIINTLKLGEAVMENLNEIWKEYYKIWKERNERDGRTFKPKYERHPAEEPGFEDSE